MYLLVLYMNSSYYILYRTQNIIIVVMFEPTMDNGHQYCRQSVRHCMTSAVGMSIPATSPAAFCSTHDIRSLGSRRDISLQGDSCRINVFSRRGAACRKDSVSAPFRPFPLTSRGRSLSRGSLGMMQNDALSTQDIVNGVGMMQNDALSTDDIVNGVGLAFALVLVYSLSSSKSDPVVWRSSADTLEPLGQKLSDKDNYSQELDESSAPPRTGGTVFGKASWKEISRPENYVYYQGQLRDKQNGIRRVRSDEGSDEVPSLSRKEKNWVLIGLLLLFVPIFSFELILNTSRQLLCDGNTLSQLGWAQDLCIPHIQ
jgi:hypothetical protein